MNAALELLVLLLMRFEGLRLHAYQDCVGVWTIGYGETLGVKPGMVWTKEQAVAQLRARAAHFLWQVYLDAPQLFSEPPERPASCGSLAYNIGLRGFHISSVRRYTNRRDYEAAARAFMLWNKAGGRVNRGLTWRRKQEVLYYSLKRRYEMEVAK
jgi:lysozyme